MSGVRRSGRDIVETARSKGSGSVDDTCPNPRTSTVQDKTSSVEFQDGLIIGCGIYK